MLDFAPYTTPLNITLRCGLLVRSFVLLLHFIPLWALLCAEPIVSCISVTFPNNYIILGLP